MTKSANARLATWLTEPLAADVARSVDRLCREEDVRHVVLMPDVHLAQDVCVGTVLATAESIYPTAVGGDIGCGMAAVAVDASRDLVGDERAANQLLDGFRRFVPSNKHAAARSLTPQLREHPLHSERLQKLAERDGRVQLGSLGRGNHFLEIQEDDAGRLWLMVHSGSRAMGQAITNFHVERYRASGRRAKLVRLAADDEAGRDYLRDVEWAREYARENRLEILRAVEGVLRRLFAVAMDWPTLIHSDHNHVRRETHGGQQMWVHRKGAQSAAEDEPGIIPGSMGSASFHVVGRGCEDSLLSCSHGAGRKLSRGSAIDKITVRDLIRQMGDVWFAERMAHRLIDEAPAVYKDIWAVMRAQRDLVKIVRQLTPVLNYKGVS